MRWWNWFVFGLDLRGVGGVTICCGVVFLKFWWGIIILKRIFGDVETRGAPTSFDVSFFTFFLLRVFVLCFIRGGLGTRWIRMERITRVGVIPQFCWSTESPLGKPIPLDKWLLYPLCNLHHVSAVCFQAHLKNCFRCKTIHTKHSTIFEFSSFCTNFLTGLFEVMSTNVSGKSGEDVGTRVGIELGAIVG